MRPFDRPTWRQRDTNRPAVDALLLLAVFWALVAAAVWG
jgi:hypothetical protein